MDEPASVDAEVTEDDWTNARAHNRHALYLAVAIGVVVGPLLALAAVYLASLTASGNARYPTTALWMAVFVAPMTVLLSVRSVKEQDKSDGVIAALAKKIRGAGSRSEV